MKKTTLLFLLSAMALPAAVQAGECYVKTSYESGSPYRGAKVSGIISYGGGVTRTVYTNSDGEAVLEWNSNDSLNHLFINGSDYGPCKNGGSVRAVLKP